MKKKLVLIGDMAVPYNVKLCQDLRRYYDTEFWFHVRLDPVRPAWWQTDLGTHCRILDNVHFVSRRRYLSFDVLTQLRRFDPDIVLLGGALIPTNYLAYRWARRHGRKVYLLSEITRDGARVPRSRDAVVQTMRAAYAHLDGVLAMSPEAHVQFRDVYGFGDRAMEAQYPADLGAYFSHVPRTGTGGLTLLYPNRLVDDYNPLAAIDIFATLHARRAARRLLMNASGPLLARCRADIAQRGLGEVVEFLAAIKGWDDLPNAYARADVMILPAVRSTGNFTIVESMASGMGIVVSDRVMGYGQMVIDGHNGFSRPPETASFVDAVMQYAQHPELFAAHAKINRDLVRRFDIPATTDLWHDLLEQRERRTGQGWRALATMP